MPRIKYNNFSRGLWLVGPGEDNPDGTLRRAKGVYPLRTQAARSRSGTLQYFGVSAHSMTRFNDEYILGASAALYRSVSLAINSQISIVAGDELDGSQLTFVGAPPTSLAIDETSSVNDYLFIAGGGELRKLSPAWALTEWGIVPPVVTGMTATQVADGPTNYKVINNCDTVLADWVGTTDPDTTPAWDPVAGLIQGTVNKIEGTGSLSLDNILKGNDIYVTDANVIDLTLMANGTTPSVEEDFITFYVRTNRPKQLQNIEIAFSVGDATFDHAYAKELAVEMATPQQKSTLYGLGDAIRMKDEKRFIREHGSTQRDYSMGEGLEDSKIAVIRRRWINVAIPKYRFSRSGKAGTSGYTWANVKAVRLSVETKKSGKANVWFDDIKMVGGTGTQGDYAYHITYKNSTTGTRSNPDLTNGPTYIKSVKRRATTLDGIPLSTDPQVDKIEIWRTLGNGSLFFKAGEVNNTDSGDGAQVFTDSVADYVGMFEGAAAVLDDEELPIDNLKPADTYEDCAGPHANRMWWSRDSAIGKGGRVYYSPQGRFEAVDGFINVGTNDDPVQRLTMWGGSLWALTFSHVYEIVNEDEPFIAREVVGAPGTTKPFCVVATAAGIIYRATDGVRIFPGSTGRSELLGMGDPLAPLWRGSVTDGFPVTFTGNYAAYGRGEYYITDSTDENRTTLACDVETGTWREIGHPFMFLYYDPEGNRLFGSPRTVVGGVWHIVYDGASYLSQSTYPYLPLCPVGAATFPSASAAQVKMPVDCTVTAIAVILNVAPGTGKSYTFQLEVNGVLNTDIVCTITGNVTEQLTTGTVTLLQGDLVCLKTTFSGVSSVQINHIAVSYKAARL